jgi:hypothetical protein
VLRIRQLLATFHDLERDEALGVRPELRSRLKVGHKRVTAAERKRRQRNLLPHLKIFLQKCLPQKG